MIDIIIDCLIAYFYAGFFVAMIVLVEIYLRLEDRLLTAGNKSFIVTDDFHAGSQISNLTRVRFQRAMFYFLPLRRQIEIRNVILGAGNVRNDGMR